MLTSDPSYNQDMDSTPVHFTVTLTDGSNETICGADAYSHEQQMTVFYRSNNQRGAIDCCSTPLASIRTADINIVRREPHSVPIRVSGAVPSPVG